MTVGDLCSICIGVLIGVKLYNRYFLKPNKKEEFEAYKETAKAYGTPTPEEAIRKSGVIYLRKGERIVELKDGTFLLIHEKKKKKEFLKDLWYGSGWRDGKNR